MRKSAAFATLCTWLALGCSGKEEQAASAQTPAGEHWLFSEFDFGDSDATVMETLEYTDGFLCYRHPYIDRCAFVRTRLEGEELAARFEFVDDRLWRMDVLTPDLDEAQASEHLERVWRLLAGYAKRFHGEAPEQAAFPDWRSLAPGEMFVTHRWKLADQEIRLVVGRTAGEASPWFTALRCVDPKWADREPAFRPAEAASPAQPSTASPTS